MTSSKDNLTQPIYDYCVNVFPRNIDAKIRRRRKRIQEHPLSKRPIGCYILAVKLAARKFERRAPLILKEAQNL